MKIIQSRLEGVPGDVVDPDAVQFASRKVAAVSGDARRALDICRRAVELAEGEVQGDPSTPSKPKANADGTPAKPKSGRVTIATIKKAINEATTNPIQQHLKGLPLVSKVLLTGLVTRIRRTGLVETTFGETLDELQRANLRAPASNPGLAHILPGGTRSGQAQERSRPAHIHTAALELVAAGLVNLESQRAERSSKLRLAIAEDEVKMALREDAELRMLGIGV